MVYVYAKVGPKGQVVIPREFRERYHIEPGNRVLFEGTAERLVVEPAQEPHELLTLLDSCPKVFTGRFDPHEPYEEQMAHRDRKRARLAKG